MLPELTPEQKMLHIQYDLLRIEFSELLTKKSEMLTYDEQFLTALYLNAVGQRQHKKYCLGVEIKMLFQRIQLMQVYINQNKLPDKAVIEKKLKKQFEEYTQKIAAENEKLKLAKKYLTDNNIVPPHIAQKVKEVYKTIVKKLHPDINPNTTEQEKDLLLQAQAAYDMCNLDALNAILLSLNMSTPAVTISSDGLKEQVAKLEEHVAKIKNQLMELEKKFPFSYRDKLADEIWITTEQENLDLEIEALVREKKKYSEYLLLMDEWKPQLLKH